MILETLKKNDEIFDLLIMNIISSRKAVLEAKTEKLEQYGWKDVCQFENAFTLYVMMWYIHFINLFQRKLHPR